MHLLFELLHDSKPGIAEPTEGDIRREFGELYSIGDPSGYVIKNFHEGFQCFVNVTLWGEVKEFSRLQFVKKVAPQQDSEDETDEEDSDCSNEPPESSILRVRCGGRDIPADYQLPPFDFQVMRALSKKQPVNARIAKQIVRTLVDHMKTEYCKDYLPSGNEYKIVVNALLREYDHLGDKRVIINRKKNTQRDAGYSWRRKLSQGFKRLRKAHHDDPSLPHLKEYRAKFVAQNLNGIAKRKEMLKHNPSLVLLRRSATSFDQFQPRSRYGAGENARTHEEHKKAIKAAWAEDPPNLTIIANRMSCCRFVRWFEMREMNLKQIQELYPCLTSEFQWILELERQMGITLKANRDATLNAITKAKLEESICRTRAGSSLFSNLQEGNTEAPQDSAILGSLPYHCRDMDSMNDLWLIVNKSVDVLSPVIQVVTTPGSPNIFDNAKYVPFLDKQRLVHEDLSCLADAFDVLVAAVTLMNIAYTPKMTRSWTLLCEFVYKIPSEQDVTDYVQSLLNEIC